MAKPLCEILCEGKAIIPIAAHVCLALRREGLLDLESMFKGRVVSYPTYKDQNEVIKLALDYVDFKLIFGRIK